VIKAQQFGVKCAQWKPSLTSLQIPQQCNNSRSVSMEQSPNSSYPPVNLPFYAAASLLPAPLPSKSEIEESTEVLLDFFCTKVVAAGTHFVIKFGQSVNLIEGENLLLVAQNTSVQVPRVYALFKDEVSRKSYIVMEYIAGETMETAWPNLTELQENQICQCHERLL